jgi:hypothetical protein
VTLTERALDKALALFREAGVMPPTDEDGWARIDGAWVRLAYWGEKDYWVDQDLGPIVKIQLYRAVEP